MPLYSIPPNSLKGISILNKLSKSNFESLLNSLKNAPKALNPVEVGEYLTRSGLYKEDDIHNVMSLIFSWYGLKEREKEKSLEALAKDIKESISATPDLEFTLEKDFVDKFISLLSIPSLALSFKSYTLSREHSNIIEEARVFTDIRPCFFEDISSSVEYANIFHTLKLVYDTHTGTEDITLTITSKNLKKLKEQLERAEKKEISLKKSLKSKINFVDGGT